VPPAGRGGARGGRAISRRRARAHGRAARSRGRGAQRRRAAGLHAFSGELAASKGAWLWAPGDQCCGTKGAAPRAQLQRMRARLCTHQVQPAPGCGGALCATLPQAAFNSLLMDCLTAAGHWGAAIAHAHSLRRAAPRLLAGRPLAGRLAACLGRSGGARAATEMARLQGDLVLPEVKVGQGVVCRLIPCQGTRSRIVQRQALNSAKWPAVRARFVRCGMSSWCLAALLAARHTGTAPELRAALPRPQARAWQAFAQRCASTYDQLAARRAALAALADQPLIKVCAACISLAWPESAWFFSLMVLQAAWACNMPEVTPG
jgi:hypothetical protein